MPLLSLASSGAAPYVGHKGARVRVNTIEEARFVESAARNVLDDRLHPGELRVIVDADGLVALEVAGLQYEIIEEDIYGAVSREHERVEVAGGARDFDTWFDDFKTLDQIYEHVYDLADLQPDLVTVSVIGVSLEGRPILGIEIGSGDKPTVSIEGVQHAREWLVSMVPVCVLDRIVRDLDTDPFVQAALANANLSIVPIVNPDGYAFTWTDERYWRKNLRPPLGVDLNRNWSEAWGNGIGSSDDPVDETYRGTAPFSEPESAAVRDFLETRPVAALIDFHTYGGVVASSWAYTNDPPADLPRLRAWGDALTEQLNATNGYYYKSLHSAEANEVLGFAAGTQADWAHAQFGIPAFLFELRPSWEDEQGGDFLVPPESIVPTCEEAVPAVLDLMRWVGSSEVPGVAITSPTDGAVFEIAPAETQVVVDVDFAGPLETVELMVNGELVAWNDTVFPHEANAEFPTGSYELIASVETWDGQKAESAPITITVESHDASDTESSGTDGVDTGGTGGESEAGENPGSPGEDGCRGCNTCGDNGRLGWLLLLAAARLRKRRPD